jgi:hypothetical protein
LSQKNFNCKNIYTQGNATLKFGKAKADLISKFCAAQPKQEADKKKKPGEIPGLS